MCIALIVCTPATLARRFLDICGASAAAAANREGGVSQKRATICEAMNPDKLFDYLEGSTSIAARTGVTRPTNMRAKVGRTVFCTPEGIKLSYEKG